MDSKASLFCWLYEFRDPLATVLGATLAAVIAPPLGLAIYRRQKEHEIVRQRYLDNGLDIIANNAEYALGVFRHNWARGLAALKHFRDMGQDMPEGLYTSGYVELEPQSYNTSYSFVLKELLDDDVFDGAQQLLYSFVLSSNTLIIYDLCSAIRISVKGGAEVKLQADRSTIIEAYFKKLYELNSESNKFYRLLGAYNAIAAVFSRGKFEFKTVQRFRQRPVVTRHIKELRAMFADELKEHTNVEP